MNQQPVQETQSPFAPSGQEDDAAERQRKEKLLSQLPTGVERGKGYFWGWDVAVYKCKGKIVKYGEMAVVKCIFSFPHTILVEGETWILLNCLTVVCFVTMLICLYTGSAESMGISDVTGRVQLLLGFVLRSVLYCAACTPYSNLCISVVMWVKFCLVGLSFALIISVQCGVCGPLQQLQRV